MLHFTTTNISWLKLFKELIAAYSEDYTKPLTTLCGQSTVLLNAKTGGIDTYHHALKR
jgi:hypothetical protein